MLSDPIPASRISGSGFPHGGKELKTMAPKKAYGD